jgi:hypothetical protein
MRHIQSAPANNQDACCWGPLQRTVFSRIVFGSLPNNLTSLSYSTGIEAPAYSQNFWMAFRTLFTTFEDVIRVVNIASQMTLSALLLRDSDDIV